MNRKNLRTLQEILLKEAREEVDRPAGVFSLWTWSNSSEASCNTTACALGSLALSKKIQGLRIKEDSVSNLFVEYIDENGQASTDADAGAAALEIDINLSAFLFFPTEYPYHLRKGACSALEVAQRVQDILDGYNYDDIRVRAKLRGRGNDGRKNG